MTPEEVLLRLAVGVACPCGKENDLLLPETACGTEFLWILRCRSCGTFGWFHAREDRAFGDAIRAVAARRGEAEGLTEDGTREAHALFEASLPPCSCAARFSVVRRMESEPCLSCGRSLGVTAWPAVRRKRRMPVPRIKPLR